MWGSNFGISISASLWAAIWRILEQRFAVTKLTKLPIKITLRTYKCYSYCYNSYTMHTAFVLLSVTQLWIMSYVNVMQKHLSIGEILGYEFATCFHLIIYCILQVEVHRDHCFLALMLKIGYLETYTLLISWLVLFQVSIRNRYHSLILSSKKHYYSLFLGFKVVHGHRCWYYWKARACYDKQQVCVYICNHSCARLVDSSRNHTFSRGTQIWCARMEDSLNLWGQTLHRWNLRLMPNISYASCPSLSWKVSAQFGLKMCIAA